MDCNRFCNGVPMGNPGAVGLRDNGNGPTINWEGIVEDVVGRAKEVGMEEGERALRRAIGGEDGEKQERMREAIERGEDTSMPVPDDPAQRRQLPVETQKEPADGFDFDNLVTKAKQYKLPVSIAAGGLTWLLSKSWIAGAAVSAGTYLLTDQVEM